MKGNQMFSSDWYRRQFQNEINLLLSSGAGRRTGRSEIPMPNLFQPGKKKDKKKNFKNGMPEGLENDCQSSENDRWNEVSGEWSDEPQDTFVQMTLQDLQEISEDGEVSAVRQQKIDDGEARPQPKKRKKRQPEKTNAGIYTKSAEELQEIILWSEILGEPAAMRRRRKVSRSYGDQSNAYRR